MAMTQQDVIKKFMASLDKTTLTGKKALDEAIAACSSFKSAQEVIDKMLADQKAAGSGDKFLKDWERLSHSGKHDMNVLKEAMMLLIANDAPLPAEWRDHQLKGKNEEIRECHVKGDLLLLYQVHDDKDGGLVMFIGAGTHSELF